MTIWQEIADHFTLTDIEQADLDLLLNEYHQRNHVQRTCKAMLTLPDAVIAHFYARLAQGNTPESPVSHHLDSSWMVSADFCFINVRATGLEEEYGNFIQAAKLLPALRAGAIHLGPFTLYDFSIIYAVSSVESISPKVVHHGLAANGCHAGKQLQALVDAAHLMEQAIGFDLEPHVAQFAVPVLMQPHLFRWIKLYKQDKQWLDYYLPNEEMLREEHQHGITDLVRDIVQNTLHDNGLTTIELAPEDNYDTISQKSQVYHDLINTMIDEGFWPVLSHTWSGIGVPEFKGYHENNYPEFRYKNIEGQEPGDRIYGVLTPFKFYQNMPINRLPDDKPRPDQTVIDFYAAIFPRWRDVYGFDFVRYDSVDHVFNSVRGGQPDYAISDRPTPSVLRQAIDASRAPAYPYVGNLAGRMGNEFRDYASIDFDLMLGSDMFELAGRQHLEKCFWLYDELTHLNRQRHNPFSVTYTIDTHDTGDPYIWGQPLLTKVGAKGLLLRQFIARFISVGKAQRPKYEVMGGQDMSYGLYHANVTDANLFWIGDVQHCSRYHYLEDIYDSFRSMLADATITERYVDDRFAWWRIADVETQLLAVVTWEPAQLQLDLSAAEQWRRYDFWQCRTDVVQADGAFNLTLHDAPSFYVFTSNS